MMRKAPVSSNNSTSSSGEGEILRVMVSDNGCGMEDIQACVGAFHTSKAHNATTAHPHPQK